MEQTTERGGSSSLFPLLVVLLAALLVTSGCAKPSGPGSAGADRRGGYASIDAPDETIELPYKPIDDGLPLTVAELAAFESTGELDKKLSQEEKEMVELHFKHYVHTRRGTVERFLKRSELYWPYVTRVLRERGLPEELACLAFVESGFNPNAVSWAGAVGMWQFMPYTGKKYGLSQDRWLDERRDPYKATHAAATYLEKLRDFFDGDWHLAIAAYNAGEGKMQRALSGTDSKTFFEICRKNGMLDAKAQLKEETQQYLPRFLAFTKIIRNVEALGFTRPDPGGALTTVTVEMPAGVDMVRFARETNLNWERFQGLNPAHLRSISPPDRKTTVRVPVGKEREALAWLQRKDASAYAGWRDYTVRQGDSLGGIAHRTGANTALLRRANNKKSNSLKIGETLLVPGSARAARATGEKLGIENAPAIARTRDGKPKTGYSGKHTIVSGDTLSSLAQAWGSSIDDICLLNDMEPSETLRLGQNLYIPAGRNIALASRGPAEKTPEAKAEVSRVSQARQGQGQGTYVVVRKGDTLFSIAQANGRSVGDLCQANNITPKTPLQAGRELYVPPSGRKAPAVPNATSVAARQDARRPKAAESRSVVIRSGDTLHSLARSNQTSVAAIAELNGISPEATLRLGQVIKLP